MIARFDENYSLNEERTYDDLDDVTKQAIDDAFSGRGIKYYNSMDDLFQELGVRFDG